MQCEAFEQPPNLVARSPQILRQGWYSKYFLWISEYPRFILSLGRNFGNFTRQIRTLSTNILSYSLYKDYLRGRFLSLGRQGSVMIDMTSYFGVNIGVIIGNFP